jgi:hypothetical protein
MVLARYKFALVVLLAFCLAGCGGSEYRFGNSPHTLTSVSVTPNTQTLTGAGQTVQFIATGNYSTSPLSADVTSQAQWSSSTPSVATVSSNGLASAVSDGTTTVSASYGGMAAGATVTVSGSSSGTRNLISVTVVPSTQTLLTVGEPGQFLAIGTYNAYPLTQDITNQVTWISSDTAVATVSYNGLAKAMNLGTATIIAQSEGIVGTSQIEVTSNNQPHQLTALTILPETGTASTNALGETVQYVAIGSFIGEPTTQDMTNRVTWTSSDVRVATVNSGGLATAVGSEGTGYPQVTTIVATATSNTNATIVGTSDLHVGNTGMNELPSLTVYMFGQGKGDVLNAPPPPNVIQCGPDYPPAGCTGHFTKGTRVILTAKPSPGSLFGGFSANCVPMPDSCSAKEIWVTSCSCTAAMNDNMTVGAVFDLQN